MTSDDWIAIRLTAQLAAVATLLLLLIGTPLAWWLARTRSALKPVAASLVAMPLVLPPTVLGFYLLLLMGPHGPVVVPWRWIALFWSRFIQTPWLSWARWDWSWAKEEIPVPWSWTVSPSRPLKSVISSLPPPAW